VTDGAIPTPEAMLGYAMGTARRLPDWHEILSYYDALAAASNRVEIERLGESTDGLPYLVVTISSPENLARRAELRQQLGQLYDPRNLDPEDERRIIDEGKVTAFLLCTQHSNEIGAALMTLELASEMAASDDLEMLEILDNVVTVIIPSHNPDGHQMIVEWYRQWLDTPYEGQPMPWLYHRYVGHDNNRDWFMLTQAETRLYAALHNREHPQLVFDMHQMGRDGARFMVPPFIDPLDPNQDPVIQQGFADLGTAIAARLTAAGKAGVATNIIFDNYSPSLAYGNYHGSVDLLSEAASVRLATPVTIDEDKLKAERGFDPRKRTWNHPMPWPGGEWTLQEIVEYDRLAALAFLEHAARNRRQWLRNYAGIMRRTVQREYGPGKSPFAFLIAEQQDDPGTAFELLETLALGGVETEQATQAFSADGVSYPAGTWVIRLGQPAGNFAKTLLELQQYPDLRRWPDGPPAPPYDIAGHTLPLQMGVRCVQVANPFDMPDGLLQQRAPERSPGRLTGEGRFGWAISPRTNRSVLAANRLLAAGHDLLRLHFDFSTNGLSLAPGSYVLQPADSVRDTLESLAAEIGVDVVGLDEPLDATLARVQPPRVGVYQSWRPSIDEGWVRWIFEEYEQPYATLHDADIRQGALRERFDTIVLPQQKPEEILNGNPHKNDYKEPYPPEYVGGLGQLGVDALRDFVELGGTLVALDSACEFAIKHLYLPVRNVVEGLSEEEFYCPGSLLRLIFDDPSHPLAFGMRRHEVGLFMKSPVFEPLSRDGLADTRMRVVASYPVYEPNLSGWILGSDKLAGKAAVLEVGLGAGRVVLIGFRAQFRAQARGTYRVLFNALQLPPSEWVDIG
jgi:hypothetical protein